MTACPQNERNSAGIPAAKFLITTRRKRPSIITKPLPVFAHRCAIRTHGRKYCATAERLLASNHKFRAETCLRCKTYCSFLETNRNHDENGSKNCVSRLQRDFHPADTAPSPDSRSAATGRKFKRC